MILSAESALMRLVINDLPSGCSRSNFKLVKHGRCKSESADANDLKAARDRRTGSMCSTCRRDSDVNACRGCADSTVSSLW